MIVHPFADQGNFTQFHNVALDVIMPAISGSAWKVLCLIVRRTKGHHVEETNISYADIKAGTGLKNDNTVSNALKELSEGAFIRIIESPDRWTPTGYRLNKQCQLESPETEDYSTTKNVVTTEIVVEAPTTEIVVPTTEIVVEPTTEIVVPNVLRNLDKKSSTTASAVVCVRAREATPNEHSPPSPEPFIEGESDPRFSSPHFTAYATACGLKMMRWKTRAQVAGYAQDLVDAGYTVEQINLAARRWYERFPGQEVTPPGVHQFFEQIEPLLRRRKVAENEPRKTEGDKRLRRIAEQRFIRAIPESAGNS